MEKRASPSDRAEDHDGRAQHRPRLRGRAALPRSPGGGHHLGRGVSPAASAAASGSPPGSAAAICAAEPDARRDPLQAAQDHALDGRVDVPERARTARRRHPRACLRVSSGSVAPSNARLPVKSS